MYKTHARSDVVSRVNVCCWCVIHNATRVSYFLFSSSSSARARFPSLEPSRRTRERAALDFLGAGLRLIPLAGQRTGRGGRARARRICLGRGRAGKRWFGWPSRARPSRSQTGRSRGDLWGLANAAPGFTFAHRGIAAKELAVELVLSASRRFAVARKGVAQASGLTGGGVMTGLVAARSP